MPEETPTQVEAPTATVVPAPGVPAAPASIKIGEEEYTPAKIEEMKQQMAAYQQDFEMTSRLVAGDTPEEERSAAIRQILLARGVPEQKIDAYLSEKEPAMPALPDETETPETPAVNPASEARLRALEERAEVDAERSQRQRMDALRMGLENAVVESVDRAQDMTVFFKEIERIYTPEELKEYKEHIRESLRKQILNEAKEINRKKGEFNLSDYNEAAAAARREVLKNARKGIPASLVGRLAATVSGPNTTAFKAMKAPEKPAYKKGESVGDVMQKTSAYNAYELTRIASEVESDGGLV